MAQRYERDDGRVTRVLKACDPLADRAFETAGIESALDEIGTAITNQPRPARRTSRKRWLAGSRSILLAGAILGLIAGGAAATKLLTDTGGPGGPGPDVRLSAPNYCRFALKLSSDIAYPSGYADWRPWVLVAEEGVKHVTLTGRCGSGTQGGHAVESTGALRGFFAMSAFCAWVYDWRHAKLDRDSAEAVRAVSVIAGAPRWQAVVAEDPYPSVGPGQNHSLFGWFLPFRSAVLDGNVPRVSYLIASNYGTAGCPYFKPPATSHGGTVNPLFARSSS